MKQQFRTMIAVLAFGVLFTSASAPSLYGAMDMRVVRDIAYGNARLQTLDLYVAQAR